MPAVLLDRTGEQPDLAYGWDGVVVFHDDPDAVTEAAVRPIWNSVDATGFEDNNDQYLEAIAQAFVAAGYQAWPRPEVIWAEN